MKTKKLLAALLSVLIVLMMLPTAAFAAEEHGSHSDGWTEFTAGTTTLSGGSYYLSGDVEYSGTESITVSGEVILCLNGHKLDLKGQHISVSSGASFTLCDCSTSGVLTGGSDGKGGGVFVDGGGTFTLTGGNIAGNTANAGGGVYVNKGGSFTMEGGSIYNNKATVGGGGGVMVYEGSFTLSGGSITGNATNTDANGFGGGVCLYGTFYLSGDSIIQNNTKAGTTDNLYLGWQTINITGPLGKNAHIGVNAENVPRSFISGWSNNMVGENPADYFSSDGDAWSIGLNTAGDAVLGSLCSTITLDPNGGTLPTYSLVEGAALPIPTKTGYTFAGWYESPEFSGNPVTDIPTNSTGELTFYAKWTANTYTVTFDANGGSVSQASAVTVAGKLTSLPTPTYDGYDFLGWYTDKDGGDEVTTNTVFTKETTIYAHWQKQECTVTFDANGGSVTTISATTKDGKLESLPTPTYDGYTFLGWYTQKDSGDKVTTETVFTADSTIYAHWQKQAAQEFTVTFDPNGGYVSYTSAVTSGGKLSALPFASKYGYTFTGWYTKNGYRVSTDTIFNGNATLYAGWVYNGIDIPEQPVKPVQPQEPEYEWISEDGGTRLYYDGEMITGWYQDEETGVWYWLDKSSGFMAADQWVKIDGNWYLFDNDGRMLTGWQKVDGKWYYLKPWGGMATGWQYIDNVWYYLRSDGSMAGNAWVLTSGKWYYLTGSGEMATNKWIQWKGDWYFLYSSGVMATNTTIDGYTINSAGIWVQ